MFADKYLKKNNKQPLINKLPNNNLQVVVVIPCLREPNIIKTLEVLNNCSVENFQIEVIVLINHSEIADDDTRNQNIQTKLEIDKWIINNTNKCISFFVIGPVVFKKKWAGVGLARKKGMDEALHRFNLLKKETGIIVSLDADTLVEPNYFIEITNHFKNNPKHIAATVAFRHQKEKLSVKQKEGIDLYELYLLYYKKALAFSGYPYAMFTIGSAFAVTALAYVKRGGMNRRQAGEDFYFLQNLVQIGTVGEITQTCVYPSARVSDRVPFGTGPILQRWMDGKEDLTIAYNINAFIDLKQLFDRIGELYKINEKEFSEFVSSLADPIAEFILQNNFWNELLQLNKNCSDLRIFRNRFFQIFNAFKILKFLNFSHNKYYHKADLERQFHKLNQII